MTAPTPAEESVHAPPAIDDALWEGTLVPLVERVIRAGWFSFDVEGAENVPADGHAVYAHNHAGWFPLDAFFVGLGVRRAIGPCRTPYFATAEAALALPVVGPFIRRVGAVPSSWFRRPERLPASVRACGFFPEGVPGNTKPFWEAYRMRPWNRGFVRVAAALDLPIVPVAVLGGEECLPVAWTVRLLEPLVGSRFGLPLALVPLPARWRVVFHPPVRLGGDRRLLTDGERSSEVARAIQATVQETLDRHAPAYPLARISSWIAHRRATAGRGGRGAGGAARSGRSISSPRESAGIATTPPRAAQRSRPVAREARDTFGAVSAGPSAAARPERPPPGTVLDGR